MGEVYRADDLKLGQPVALKFLPADVEQRPLNLARFHEEVRLSREVTHPNVCRVHDLVEAAGHSFLSMEYVDGEDLASLLRRIGRLPRDKAVRVAHQICLGLGAAHAKGILHRDLKPANIMIDGRGDVRITDFGLAILATATAPGDLQSGTPAYMAPEQFAGRDVTVRSEIYALGLVLYELFTGKPAFEAPGLPDLMRLRDTSAPPRPSIHVEGLDPAIERTILRCLDREPERRPPSALAVAAALPGGDPLRAAIAAGETPSPEMVAAVGGEGALGRRTAWLVLIATLAALFAAVVLESRTRITSALTLEKSRDVLQERAREVVRRLGYANAASGEFGFEPDGSYLARVESERDVSKRRSMLAAWPAAIRFWYRESPGGLTPLDSLTVWRGRSDPPVGAPGTVEVVLGSDGTLVSFEAVPVGLDSPGGDSGEPDWPGLFAVAGLDPARFVRVEPSMPPPRFADRRAAWSGAVGRSGGEVPVRIDAAALHGRPVFFSILASPGPTGVARADPIGEVFEALVYLGCLAGGALIARHNLKRGREHREGAIRIASVTFVLGMAAWVFGASHLIDLAKWRFLIGALARACWSGLVVWVYYVASEPFFRRLWPERIAAWIRLLEGRFRDPAVGREVLLGTGLGVAGSVVASTLYWLGEAVGAFPPRLGALTPSLAFQMLCLRGPRQTASLVLSDVQEAVYAAMLVSVALLIARFVLGKPWLSIAGVFAVGVPYVAAPDFGVWGVFFALMLLAVEIVAVLRVGVLAMGVAVFVFAFLLNRFPATLDLSVWYATGPALVLLIPAALALYGFRLSISGRKAFEITIP
jgi:serine/threonine-protein kinase